MRLLLHGRQNGNITTTTRKVPANRIKLTFSLQCLRIQQSSSLVPRPHAQQRTPSSRSASSDVSPLKALSSSFFVNAPLRRLILCTKPGIHWRIPQQLLTFANLLFPATYQTSQTSETCRQITSHLRAYYCCCCRCPSLGTPITLN